jgi:SAM-dependent methyltransferase
MAAAARDWRSHWRQVGRLSSGDPPDAMRQVGKTRLGVPVDPEQLDLIVAAIRRGLDIRPEDHLLELGCGNGLITERVAREVASVRAFDVSAVLVEDARRFRSADNVDYAVGDLTDAAVLEIYAAALQTRGRAKLFAYEVLQHLRPDEVAGFLRGVAARFGGGAELFFGSLPDRDRLRAFYDTPERWRLYQDNLASGREQIGTWWAAADLEEIAAAAGHHAEILAQDEALYTAHYRFDARLRGSASRA